MFFIMNGIIKVCKVYKENFLLIKKEYIEKRNKII